jgi:hypothetical protein
MVAHEQGHPIAGLQTGSLKLARQLRTTLRPLAVCGHHLGAVQEGWPLRRFAGLALQQMGKVQFGGSRKMRIDFGLDRALRAVSRTSWLLFPSVGLSAQ